MRALVLGGTGWLGRAVVRDMLAAGTDVTCLTRGTSGEVPEGAHLVRADRQASGAYDGVRGDWDDIVELSADPDLVEPALDALADRAAHWTLVSTVSVYTRNDQPDADETATLVEPRDLTQYADAKVSAERSSAARLGSRLLIGRPGLVVGPGDPSDRFGYWPARLSLGGRVLSPTTAGRFVQVIDVGDLAAWIGHAGRTGQTGVVNAVGPAVPLVDFLRQVTTSTAGPPRTAGHDTELVEVEDDVLLDRDVRYWAGPRSLPLWLPRSDAAFAQRSGRAFVATGGRTRPLEPTVAAVLADERARGLTRARRSGLTPVEEDAVLRSLR
ncbi:NAD-dependent epimerase/dehydratase family protein [Curtobacterium sp. MCLR17_007]|uniref:NAD-dependent epimerase/dehydratase family protein n=1 Tax=Curtobacterium sp. MCLR17_007 TaxID=2175648 RepID=UPI000DA9FDE0|nr:NAD-dependent epimerase/dehydratase family protein [Curtobacterium sp. MCLR17_007]WIB60174.1 NAD-dependent epimerase/dehydratase family protein [Curtobacterium sp. MCLR17_007]